MQSIELDTSPPRAVSLRSGGLAAGFLLSLMLALGACGGGPAEPEAEPEAPREAQLAGGAEGWNLLLVSVDTVRADRLNAYGYGVRPTSPHLDALMSQGVRFEEAVAPRASTWPSLATVLTGLYPTGHGVIVNGYELPEGLPTLPLILEEAGYETGAFLSNMCQAGHRGWGAFRCSQGRDGRAIEWALEWAQERAQERTGAGGGEGRPGAKPYFLWLHLFGAHSPYYNGGDLAARKLDPDYTGDLVPKKWRLNRIMEEKEQLSDADVTHLNAIYDAAVIGTDRLVGRFLDGLREQGLLERTVVVFLSDHGEDLYQHNGYLYHACSVYQSGLHVPLSITAPGLVAPGGAVPQPVELGDVAPTVLELLGLPALEEAHGRSLVPYLERPGRGGQGKPAFSEYGETRIRTVQNGSWKLVHNPDRITPYCFEGPKDLYPIEEVELYDLEQDPLEQNDLAVTETTRVAELQEMLRRRFAALKSRGGAQEIPEELKEELRSLGYVAN